MNLSATTEIQSVVNHTENYKGDGTTLYLPTAGNSDTSFYFGAITGTKSMGKNTHVVYPDYSSLYPNIIWTINISPDTVVGTQEDLDESPYDESDCIWGYIDTRPVKYCDDDEDYHDFIDTKYKAVFKGGEKKWSDEPQSERCYYLRPDVKEGFVTGLIEQFMEQKDAAKGTHLYSATKATVNSLYGVLGFSTEYSEFRLFDIRNAETVSLMGRKFLQLAMKSFVEYSKREYDTHAYVTHYDTDGCGIALDVQSQSEALEIAHNAAEYLRDVAVPQFLKDECGYTDDLLDHHTMEADIEYYAPSIYNHDASKRYAKYVTWDEGEDVDEVSITGFEAIRSDVADITVEVQTEVFNLILRNELHEVKDKLYEYINDTITAVEDGTVPIEKLGIRGGIGKPLSEYGTKNRTPQPVYRASRWSNQNVDGENLGEASKPYYWPITEVIDDSLPKRYSSETAEDGDAVDYVAAEDPHNVEDLVRFDYNTMATKLVSDRVRPIIENIEEYEWDELRLGHAESSLSHFM